LYKILLSIFASRKYIYWI